MSTQLPTTPDGLSLREIQSVLDSFRSLQAGRPAKLRELRQQLHKFYDQVWLQSAETLRQNDPEAGQWVIDDLPAAAARLAACAVAILITAGFYLSGINALAIVGFLLACLPIWWSFRTWPSTTRLELFLNQIKPPFQLIFGASETQIIALTGSLGIDRQNLKSFKGVIGMGFTVNEQWGLIVDLESKAICRCQEVSPFTMHRLRVIGGTMKRLLQGNDEIYQMAQQCFFLNDIENLIRMFERAQGAVVDSIKPGRSQPATCGVPRTFFWSTKELDQAFMGIAIGEELRNDLIRRFDRFVSGKMTGCPGLLLYGPPGSGKTSIARVLSKLAELELFSVKLSDLKGAALGSGAQNVGQLWERVRQTKGKALLFIDELDAIFPSRSGTAADVLTVEMVSAFCAEWDGIEQRESKTFVLGATNRPDGVDTAILSRFGTQKEMPLPNKDARKKILLLELAAAGLTDVIVPDCIIQHTAGMSGRDLHTVVQELAVATHPRQPYFGDLIFAVEAWRKDRSLERNDDATWDRLIVSSELKDTLEAYCRILKNYEQFKAQGVYIPRGLLLFGPSGTGKTQIARTLSCQAAFQISAARPAT